MNNLVLELNEKAREIRKDVVNLVSERKSWTCRRFTF